MLNFGSLLVNGLDYILIVDKNYKVIYNTRYDAKINDNSKEYRRVDIANKYYFDVYPKLRKEDSSIARCIEKVEVIINKKQHYEDYQGKHYVTNNITLPLRRKGELVAVVELAMDVNFSDSEYNKSKEKRFDEFVQEIRDSVGLITFDTILTGNEEMRQSIEKAKILSILPNATLIYGETGTGKELFAQAMINYSGVPKSNVVIQNCAAVPENLMESILFGTVRGAYTGAENKKGLFEVADGGIIFLDELNSMPYHVQAKLLRVLQDGSFKPLGSNEDKKVSTKVIAAMNIDLEKAIQRKILRKDLFYRFSGGLITLLPLRERREDIIMYTNYYINYFSDIYDKKVGKLSKDLEEKFYRYSWEGNVRELMNTVEFMVTTARNGEDLTENLIPAYLRGRLDNVFSISDGNDIFSVSNIISEHKCKQSKDTHIPYHNIMKTVEKELILKAMEAAEGNKSKASEILGLPRQTFRYRLQKLGLEELSD